MPMSRLCGGTLLMARAVEEDFAGGGRLETGQHHQAGGLAGAGRTEQGEKLALADVQVEVFDDQAFAVVALLHALETDEHIAGSILGHHTPLFLLPCCKTRKPCSRRKSGGMRDCYKADGGGAEGSPYSAETGSALGPAGEALLQGGAVGGPEGGIHADAACQVGRCGGQVGADLGVQRGDGLAVHRAVGDLLGEAALRFRLAGEGDETARLLGLADALGQRPVIEVVDTAVPARASCGCSAWARQRPGRCRPSSSPRGHHRADGSAPRGAPPGAAAA